MKRSWMAAMICCGIVLCSGTASAAEPEGLQAKSAILVTDSGQVLYENNADEQHPPASVTKLMTMLLIMEAVDSGTASLEDMVTASAHAASMGGSQIYLKEGEQMTLEDMLKSIAVASANDAAAAVAEHFCGSEQGFVQKMNERAKALGCTGTEFVNPNGLDLEGQETKTTAHDLARISVELLKHEKILDYTSIWMDTIRDGAFGLANTNKMLRLYDGLIGLKTGYTSTAGYCISAAAEREGFRLIAVVLGEPTKEARNADVTTLLNYGYAEYAMAPITEESMVLPKVSVTLGTQETVAAELADDTPAFIERSAAESVQREIQMEETIEAPVEKGQKIGEIILRRGEEEWLRRDIIAAEAVERKSVSDIFRELLSYLLMKNAAFSI